MYIHIDVFKIISFIFLKGHARAKFEIEQAQLFLMYRSVSQASVHITTACDLLGLKYELTGKLGKRTKHQETDKPQLCLEITLLEKENIQRPPIHKLPLPQNVRLKDDVLLDQVTYVDEKKSSVLLLPNTEQKLLLTIIQHTMISKPRDDLFYEEIEPFINTILSQNNTWPVCTGTLLLRSKLEADHSRKMERSLSQCEEILNAYRRERPHPLTRIGGVYGIGLQPIWKTEAQYADIMFKLGLVKAALDVYQKMQMWEEVIGCYTALKLKHKAAEVIKQQLEIKPSIKLLCWLGWFSILYQFNFFICGLFLYNF